MFHCGIVFIVLGVAFLLANLGVIGTSTFNIIVALVSIVVGVKCFLKKKGGHHSCCGGKDKGSEK